MGIPIISVQAPWLGVMVTTFRASPLGVTVQSLWKCCASLLGKGFGPKEERKIILITCHDPSAADARHSVLLWALFPLGLFAPACLPPAPVLASRLPKSCPLLWARSSCPWLQLPLLLGGQAASFPRVLIQVRPGQGSPPVTRAAVEAAGAPWWWL